MAGIRSAAGSHFHGFASIGIRSRFVVLGIKGKQVTLPSTLKLTAALRGLLMGACPVQPPPEWFSGHRADGTATSEPHLALIPLPFVGSQHADSRPSLRWDPLGVRRHASRRKNPSDDDRASRVPAVVSCLRGSERMQRYPLQRELSSPRSPPERMTGADAGHPPARRVAS